MMFIIILQRNEVNIFMNFIKCKLNFMVGEGHVDQSMHPRRWRHLDFSPTLFVLVFGFMNP